MKKVKYDEKANILSIKLSNKKSVDSDMQGKVVLDYDKDGDLVNIDMMGVKLSDFSESAKEKLEMGKNR